MKRLVPPAGTPITWTEIKYSLNLNKRPENKKSDFNSEIKTRFDVKHCFSFNSGRAALFHILEGLKELTKSTDKTEVVIPAYTCFSVPAAIARSGLKAMPVDINPTTLDYNYKTLEKIDFKHVLALIGCNMLGILCDWDKLRSICQNKRIFLIDDAAQSMGSQYKSRPSGGLGDIGFYSLGRGKNLSCYSGGVLVTSDDDLAKVVGRNYAGLKKMGPVDNYGVLLKLLLYSLFLRPHLYWIPSSVPFLGLGETEFDTNFEISALSAIQQNLGAVLIENLELYNSIRAENSRKLARTISILENYRIPGMGRNLFPQYLRFPVLCPDKQARDKAAKRLKKKGIVSSEMYPSIISNIPGIKKHLADIDGMTFRGAQEIVDKLLCLPIHPYVTDKDITEMGLTLAEI